jgi:pilus assembly protein Flp/PilA
MARFRMFSQRFMQDESGQDLIEYALVAGLIGVVAVGAMTLVGGSLTGGFNTLSSAISSAL